MSNVSRLGKIDSLSLVLPPNKISWFLDNINYASRLFVYRVGQTDGDRPRPSRCLICGS